MNNETLKALEGSIQKWERIVDCDDIDMGNLNCDLCDVFYNQRKDNACEECLIGLGCIETPYADWAIYQSRFGSKEIKHAARLSTEPTYMYVFDQKSYNLALAELEFLKSLLPGEP